MTDLLRPEEWTALRLSLLVAMTATAVSLLPGLAIGYVLVNLIVDLSYAILDPRIQLD